MKSRTLFFAALLLLFNLSSKAQVEKAEITFAKAVYQLGTVKEASGDVNINYEFTNSGNTELTVRDVKAEPGITVTDWTKTSVAPGEKGSINVVFHPMGNPNRVYKKVTVYSNAKRAVETLSIVGNVTPIPGSVADKYRKNLGTEGLRLKNTYVNFGNVTNKATKELTVNCINDSEKEMKLSFKNVPAQITVNATPETLKPHAEGVFTITYNGGMNKNKDGSQKWGAQNDRFYVVINGDESGSRKNAMIIKASIMEDFDNMSPEEMAKAPKIEFKEVEFDFGTINQGDVVKHDFVFTNTGENDLEIRHVKAT